MHTFAMKTRKEYLYLHLLFCVAIILNSQTLGTSTSRNNCKCENYGTDIICQCKGRNIKDIPTDMSPNTTKLTLTSVGIKILKNDSLKSYESSLRDLHIEDAKELEDIEPNALRNCIRLRTLYITQAPKLKKISDGVFAAHLPSFKMLRIAHSGLEVVPNMNQLRTDPTIIAMIDFDSNKIKNITSSSLKVKAENLVLDHNEISLIEDWSFHDSQIANLSLKGNRNLRIIEEDAFTGLKNLRTLDLSETSLEKLPTRGLESLEVLRVRDTSSMREFPSVLHFPEIREAYLTYPYHCCAFQFPVTHDPEQFLRLQSLRDVHRKFCNQDTEQVTTPGLRKRFIPDDEEDGFENEDNGEEAYGHFVFTPSPEDANDSFRWAEELGQLLEEGCFQSIVDEKSDIKEDPRIDGSPCAGSRNRRINYPQFGERTENIISDQGIFHPRPVTLLPAHPVRAICGHFTRHFRQVTCLPEPDAFSPCEDVMGHWALRGAVWLVSILALFGNLAVLTVILTAKSTMTVSKFLMCHLAFADLCMGVYLLIIACEDARTVGSYFNHAIDWQNGAGCQIAGFLTVFASELSVLTLTVITLERWYAITYAIHLNRRLHLGAAARVMTVCWIYAALAAAAPLFGISGYSKTSICLPMESKDAIDVIYLVCLLTFKGLAFLLICICYLKMYLSIRTSSANRQTPDLHANRAVRSDLSVAKRMAMLVFTDFFCWAPIAFFGLTALIGHPLIDVTRSKILLVTFYPLNSCANPFLYAILTKQYRRDARLLLAGLGIVRRRSVHGRTLSTNINQRRLSSVKALYRGSLGHHRQHIVLSNSGITSHRVNSGDYLMPDSKTPNFTGIRKDDAYESVKDARAKKGSPTVHRGSPHPIRNNFTKVQHPDQQVILRRVLEMPPSSQVTTTTTTTTDVTTCEDEDTKDTAV